MFCKLVCVKCKEKFQYILQKLKKTWIIFLPFCWISLHFIDLLCDLNKFKKPFLLSVFIFHWSNYICIVCWIVRASPGLQILVCNFSHNHLFTEQLVLGWTYGNIAKFSIASEKFLLLFLLDLVRMAPLVNSRGGPDCFKVTMSLKQWTFK